MKLKFLNENLNPTMQYFTTVKVFTFLTCFLFLISGCSTNNVEISFTYPNGKTKALIMSYDDGHQADIRLSELFTDYGIVGTFNLNSGFLSTVQWWPLEDGDSVDVQYLSFEEAVTTLSNHEIAVHGTYHKDFFEISNEEIEQEITSDKYNLQALAGYEMKSMAYPFGNGNAEIAELVKKAGLTNARTINDTYTFELPPDYFLWDPTVHDSRVMELADEYIDLDTTALTILYVWGHSWELNDSSRWENMFQFCELIGGRKDIWYTGSGLFVDYLSAIEEIRINGKEMFNPTPVEIFYQYKGDIYSIRPGENYTLDSD